ncbi:MAG: hypothetical protein LRY73_09315 [Bacillus sp. (in: Bacteria)]|nr:hypothetical protein [Bacillus sp. (in: firmicutes)]
MFDKSRAVPVTCRMGTVAEINCRMYVRGKEGIDNLYEEVLVMVKRCKVCRKKPRLERRVNNEGVVFCSDDCYEKFENSPNDMDHPYIDDYDAVRFE